ncbi:uncharacterized protein BKCO1_3000198 [Diplodia corticola]|uniref:Uncharacterized protein n=1 Tax=Diplodia corticola TaxID=236234 RepID=A0A1J9SEY8_9PEZI|nr:uncharacterized protein BKCO1_3000198 [Diplodia corticola]OJD38975.1 hypothetical protein BKCO1_3000198 [Diplodia corticola]
MLQSPAAAASSQATLCSLRAPAHVPPSHSPRSPSRPHRSTQSDPFCHVSLHTPEQALLTREDTSYDPAALSLQDDCRPAHRARQSPKALSTAFIHGCRPLVDRATSSLSAFQNQSRAAVPSPAKSQASFIPSRRDPTTLPDEQKPSRASVLGDWFNRPYAAYNLSSQPTENDSESDIGSDSDLDSDDDIMDTASKRATAGSLRSVKSVKRASTQSVANNSNNANNTNNNNSIFASWFSRKSDGPKRNMPQDPLSVLDIESALFPNGPADPQDPASFHELHKTSVALLQQFQSSYKAMQLCMQDTRLEEDGLIEEKKQAEVHARSLQMQLDNLKAEADLREKESKALREALERESQLRADEEEARIVSLRAMKACKCNRKSTASSTISSEPSGVLSDRDSGFESEGETITDDLAYRSRPTSMASESDIPELESTPSTAPTSAPSPVEPSKPTLFKRKSTVDAALQKKRNSKMGGSAMPIILTGAGKMNDTNGQMDVWRENRDLRERVEALERTVDETLGIVGGLEAGIIY